MPELKEQISAVGELANENFDKPREECGVVAVYAPGGSAVQAAHKAIRALQHRGQEAAGVSFVGRAGELEVIQGLGKVAEVFGENGERVAGITGPEFATGHARYPTSNTGNTSIGTQPLRPRQGSDGFALAQNGHLHGELILELADEYGIQPDGTDSMILTDVLGVSAARHGHIEPAMHEVLPKLTDQAGDKLSAFCLTILTKEAVYAVKDPNNIRPLVLGKMRDIGGVAVASEIDGLTAAAATFEREVEPGTYLAINGHGVREVRWAEADPLECVFEHIYLSKPTNVHGGQSVREFRLEAGERLARLAPVEADLVIPVEGSGRYYAQGYAKASGIPYEKEGLIKKERKGQSSDRTFIEPTQSRRRKGVRDKFEVNSEVVAGKRLIVADDSLVRGNTMYQIVDMLREAGASEVHVRIPSPRFINPCRLGVDVPTREELFATGRSVEQMARELRADSLAFLPIKETMQAAGSIGKTACTRCLEGGRLYSPTKTLGVELALA